MDSSIRPRYVNENGITYYRTMIVHFNNNNKRYYGNDIKSKFMKDFTSMEVYGNDGSEHPLLCYVISNFNSNNKIDTSYIFYEDEELLPSIKNKDTLHIYDNCDKATKLIFINFKAYIEKLLGNVNYTILPGCSHRPITIYSYMNLNNYKLRIDKSINLYSKYLKNFKNIPTYLKSDFEDISKIAIDIETINKDHLDHIIRNVLNLPVFISTNRHNVVTLSKFNNLKIIYNNYDIRRHPSSEELEMFDSFKEYDKILKDLNLKEPKYIQLKGIKFSLSDRIYIMDGFTTYTLQSAADSIKQYILTVCNIESLRAEIEKLILYS